MSDKSARSRPAHKEQTVSTYYYQCVAGPDPLEVRIEDDVATEITPNFDTAAIHPVEGKVCVKAFGLVQKAYTPNRALPHAPVRGTGHAGPSVEPGWTLS
jgi:phenylacetyl-CoA:acceptor oxidoreductase